MLGEKLSIDERLSRRQVVKTGSLAALALFFPSLSMASAGKSHLLAERKLSFYNMHTGESLNTVYYAMGRYVPDSLNDINYILRDHRSGEVRSIDRSLLDLLHELSLKLETKAPFYIISGYRSPKMNALLRRRSSGVAKKSFHLFGRAIDMQVPGRDLKDIRKEAMRLKWGGVGYYPGREFVHLDTGPFRHWSG